MDFYVTNNFTFHLNIPSVIFKENKEYQEMLTKTVDSITSFLVSINANPVIRYSANSRLTKEISTKLNSNLENMEKKKLFSSNNKLSPLILVIDRKEDPVTPLLLPWTYQSMLHEELEIKNNKIKVIIYLFILYF